MAGAYCTECVSVFVFEGMSQRENGYRSKGGKGKGRMIINLSYFRDLLAIYYEYMIEKRLRYILVVICFIGNFYKKLKKLYSFKILL